jgi:hypothetical protein
MIVCHTHKFIFVKTQKTASTSLEIALSRLCDSNDIITPITKKDEEVRKDLGFLGPRNYYVPFKKYSKRDWANFLFLGKRVEFYNHMSCFDIQKYISKTVYNDYYKFCFERNPYDKVISLFFHKGGYEKWNSIENFINAGSLQIIKGYDQYTINKILAVDAIFKFEDMSTALQTISERLKLKEPLKLPEEKLKSQFRKDKRQYSEVLSANEKHLIDVIWARERELMGYTF